MPETYSLPEVGLLEVCPYGDTDLRKSVLKQRKALQHHRESLSQEARKATVGSPERNALYAQVQGILEKEASLEHLLENQFIPVHSDDQLLSPRALFVSPLFCVKSKATPRAAYVSLKVGAEESLSYVGPELRQSDGLVFLALINMARDVRAGLPITFDPEALCRSLIGQYNGPARARLKESIQRLQQALLKFERFSMQLCQRFDYPSRGHWTVAMDPHIVALFLKAPNVWLNLGQRLALPEGLCTWLYAYVESQTTLIPIKTETLRELCGSDATVKAFENKLRDALRHLVLQGVLAPEWRIEKGLLRWMKQRPAASI